MRGYFCPWITPLGKREKAVLYENTSWKRRHIHVGVLINTPIPFKNVRSSPLGLGDWEIIDSQFARRSEILILFAWSMWLITQKPRWINKHRNCCTWEKLLVPLWDTCSRTLVRQPLSLPLLATISTSCNIVHVHFRKVLPVHLAFRYPTQLIAPEM